jgi:lysophospholipase L1-like esterase|tara:strand:- start:502 stop:1200 length:699 start_codon:yes stop_codon:yes gene_type:complete
MLRRITLPVFLTYLAFAAQSVDANPIRYVAIGDSYTVATGIEEKDSWPSQLTQKLKSAGIEINLIEILGMRGATSQQTLNEVMPQLKNLKPGFITLLIGVNDWIREGISSSKFKIRIKNLIDEIQSNLPPKKLLLITIPDFSCSPQKKNWGYGKSATNGITRLNKILKTEAALRDLVIVDIYPLSQNLCSQVGMFSDDGVHPSALQYSKWVDLIFPHLIDNLKLKSKDLKKS